MRFRPLLVLQARVHPERQMARRLTAPCNTVDSSWAALRPLANELLHKIASAEEKIQNKMKSAGGDLSRPTIFDARVRR